MRVAQISFFYAIPTWLRIISKWLMGVQSGSLMEGNLSLLRIYTTIVNFFERENNDHQSQTYKCRKFLPAFSERVEAAPEHNPNMPYRIDRSPVIF